MNLTYWEQDFIHTRMGAYDIKYQEIYNELFDHITTAIEAKREAGDRAGLEIMYQDVVEAQFGGYFGIVKVAASYEKAYKDKLKKMIWGNYGGYINFQSFVFTAALIALSFVLPHNKITIGILFTLILAAAAGCSAYAFITLRSIKPSKGTVSLVYSHIITTANLPLTFVNAALWLPQLLYIFSEKDGKFKLFNSHPAVLALMLALLLIYDLSCIRLCRQELRQYVHTKL